MAENVRLAHDMYRMTLLGEHAFTRPGQFCQVALPGHFLRRPFSVSDWQPHSFAICYRPAGQGTREMAAIPKGAELDVLTGLGNGFYSSKGRRPVLVGGGTGVAPLVSLARLIQESGREVVVLLGFESDGQVCLDELFASFGCLVHVATVQPGAHVQGLVTDLLDHAAKCDHLYACGPEGMMRAIHHKSGLPGQYSLECRMGCGFGVCNGCHVHTVDGASRICVDGPVFEGRCLDW